MESEPASPDTQAALNDAGRDDLVELDSFVFPDEAGLAQALLETAWIPSYLANEYTLSVNWNLTRALGGLKLMVPRGMVAEAREVLAARISDDDLAAQAEAAGEPDKG